MLLWCGRFHVVLYITVISLPTGCSVHTGLLIWTFHRIGNVKHSVQFTWGELKYQLEVCGDAKIRAVEPEPKQFWKAGTGASQKISYGWAGAWNLGSCSTGHSLLGKRVVRIKPWFLVLDQIVPDPELKIFGGWSWNRSPKFEFRLHSPG